VSERRFEGRVAVVTGGASGIGEATVRRLVGEGARVAVGDVNGEGLEALAEELGAAVAPVVCDVTRETDVEGLVAAAVDRFGRLDAGFNVAGAARGAPIDQIDLADWRFTVDLCLTGVFLSMKHEARQFLRQGGAGAIVNVASLNSIVPMFQGASYCAAKAGAAMLGACGALEWGESGIRVNTVSPGLTETPLTGALRSMPGVVDAYLDRIPMKEIGRPEQIASAAVYLASDDASYISGVNLVVDGAWSTSGYPDLRPWVGELG
jgi:meso-butanediol dehydrogenase/(S,S)-butanediol dehydrogenase/diacetyl reductase